MPSSIFHESMSQGITYSVLFCLFVSFFEYACCLLFLMKDTSVFFGIVRDGISFITMASVGVGSS